ncbi:MAG: FliH/SctL family protein, partial [Burkholderiaceae bacterium]
MNQFCVDSLTPAPSLRPDHGLLRDAALVVTADAAAAADHIVESARAEAEAMLQAARSQAQQIAQAAEQQALERAQQLIATLQAAQASFLAGAESIVLDIVQGVFDRLVIDTTPRERIAAAYQRVQAEAPSRLVTPLLRVHPDDFDLLPSTDWEVKPDPAMARGRCRLEAASGE